jgi:heme exporter protein D
MSAGGPALYAVGVAMATPRLQPRLCLFAGLAAAAQLIGIVQFVLRPAASPELLASGAYDFYVTLAKAIFLVTIGALGLVASRSMRSLLLRLTESAVERERVRGLHALAPELAAPAMALRDQSFALLVGVIERGVAQGLFSAPQLAVTAAAIATMGLRIPYWYEPEGALKLGTLADLHVGLALRMLGVHSTP